MNAERFEHLAQAYGGDIRRWPAAEQDAAFAWLAAHADARALLIEAAALDAVLNASPPAPANEHLRQRLMFSAPRGRPVFGRIGALASGLGLAAACAAGVVIGVNNASLFDPAPAQVQMATTSAVVTSPAAQVFRPPPQQPAVAPVAEDAPAADVGAADFSYGGDWFSGLESEG